MNCDADYASGAAAAPGTMGRAFAPQAVQQAVQPPVQPPVQPALFALPAAHGRQQAARERRLALLERCLAKVEAALDAANLDDLDEKQARRLLPTMRSFLKDLLLLQRGELASDHAANPDALELTEEQQRTADRMLALWQAACGFPTSPPDSATGNIGS